MAPAPPTPPEAPEAPLAPPPQLPPLAPMAPMAPMPPMPPAPPEPLRLLLDTGGPIDAFTMIWDGGSMTVDTGRYVAATRRLRRDGRDVVWYRYEGKAYELSDAAMIKKIAEFFELTTEWTTKPVQSSAGPAHGHSGGCSEGRDGDAVGVRTYKVEILRPK